MTLKIRREHGKPKVHRSHMPGGRRFPLKGHQKYAEKLARQAERLEAELRAEQEKITKRSLSAKIKRGEADYVPY